MPILIENTSPDRDESEAHDYRLSINGKQIATFTHYRDLGLAEAVRRVEGSSIPIEFRHAGRET
jgi:hypothetical protein